ncbi:hypothetical protein [Myxococcus landrumensis]|uniref:hypothetical protein n=1 Tax=Myxococcus landrumensis TaxID=2813577 RepID=UPI001F509FDD|nr:hypothetical protein [Myxococcus landrumus]
MSLLDFHRCSGEQPRVQEVVGECRLLGDDAVSKEPQSVDPVPQPISHSTNRGFKVRAHCED